MVATRRNQELPDSDPDDDEPDIVGELDPEQQGAETAAALSG